MITSEIQLFALNLLSGLLGSIIGSLIGYKGAMNAAHEQVNHLYELEKQKKRQDRKDQEKQMLRSFYVEAQENIKLANKWGTHHAKAIMIKETWNLYKGSILSFDPGLQEALLKTYFEIDHYNALVEYDRMKVAYGSGSMDSVIQKQAGVVRDVVSDLLKRLAQVFR